MSDRLTSKVDTGHRVYLLKMKMHGSTLGGFIFLTHEMWFEDSKLQEMVREATKICIDARIGTRRREMAEQKTPVPEPVKTNETLFAGDVDFVEAVLCDKWGFRRLMYSVAEDEIEPTVKI